MDGEIILKRIKARLSQMGVDFDSVEPVVQKNLLKIETEIYGRFCRQQEAIATLNANKININTISKSGAISNKTVYRYDILISYIKACEDEYNALLPGGKDAEKSLREKLADATETIRKMNLQTVDVELLKAEIDQLKADAADDATKIKNLVEENLHLQKELQTLRSAHPEVFEKRRGTVIVMPGVTQD